MSADSYESPLGARYASARMRSLFSERRRIAEWRRLWIALARAESELGLPITAAQVAELEAGAADVDFARARAYEERLRHDVMAHIHAFGDAAPGARGVIHLGATSCFVTDNADLILMREALDLLLDPLASTLARLAAFAREERALPCLAYTHFQPAQLTTVGKRACLWLQDLLDDLKRLAATRDGLRFRGVKGTTGTQASFLALFHGDHAKVKELERRVAAAAGFERTYPICGQTYPRKLDFEVLAALAGLALSAGKMAADLRLLAHEREVEEPFEEHQVGSSAMAYKRNPMRCERICSLARFIAAQVDCAAQTAMNQWLERTLDDSACRRLVIPESFLAADGMLQTLLNVSSGLVVHEEPIRAHVARELPFMATEEILMAATRAGGDRQKLHEAMRRHSLAAAERLKRGEDNDLLERIAADDAFAAVRGLLPELTRAERFVGRAPEQVDEFLASEVEPVLWTFRDRALGTGDVRV
ncbi:MAG: adenylosuccinate lyase [Planctomycetes bacterium]|nr:adenylosuccinate lyase [Planctomycetota bacterium]